MVLEEMAERLEEAGSYRILRRVDLSKIAHARDVEADFDLSAGLALDMETTGTDPERDSIVALAARVFWFRDGEIVALGDCGSWLEDPGAPLSAAVGRLTGLADDDLRGQRIDEEAFGKLLLPVDFVVGHNAGFDRKFFEARFPMWRGLAWACSMSEIAWQAHGFDGRGLKGLVMQAGWFSERSHRAGADVDALIALLTHRFGDDGRTALAEMVETARRATWRVVAQGANFDVKSDLKSRGYRWDPRACVWWREVEEGDLASEKDWLAANVYAPRHYPLLPGPAVERVTWRERHARHR